MEINKHSVFFSHYENTACIRALLNHYRIPFDTKFCFDSDSLMIISDYEFGVILHPPEAKEGTEIMNKSNRLMIFFVL